MITLYGGQSSQTDLTYSDGCDHEQVTLLPRANGGKQYLPYMLLYFLRNI